MRESGDSWLWNTNEYIQHAHDLHKAVEMKCQCHSRH